VRTRLGGTALTARGNVTDGYTSRCGDCSDRGSGFRDAEFGGSS